MNMFSQNSCIGITWDQDGACRGVKICRRNDAYVISDTWHHSPETEEELPIALQRGVETLAAGENPRIIAGGAVPESGFLDLDVPDLNPDELRSLLTYELRKQSPVEETDIVWGYRKLPADGAGNGKNRLRLIYMREIAWRRWVDNISSIARGIDALLPPFAAVDPVLRGRPVALAGNGRDYVLASKADGLRTVLRCHDFPPECFGAGPEPLACQSLRLGQLQEFAPSEQSCFTGAVILALYGLGDTLRADRKTLLDFPLELRRRPHKASVRLGALLAVYLIAILMFGGIHQYLQARSYLDELNTEISQTRQAAMQLADSRQPIAAVQAIREEVQDLKLNEASLTECLIELTRLLDDRYWVSSLHWNQGKIQLQIRTAIDDLSFIEALEQSPILADVVPVRKVVDHENNLTIQVQMHTVFPKPGRGEITTRSLPTDRISTQ